MIDFGDLLTGPAALAGAGEIFLVALIDAHDTHRMGVWPRSSASSRRLSCARPAAIAAINRAQANHRRVLEFNIFLTDLAIMGFKISNVYLFLAVDPNGDESVPAFSGGDVFMPLVGTDPARVDELREIAKQLSRESGIKITLCRFSVREDLEVIDGRH